MIAFIVFSFLSGSLAATIQAGLDIQDAVDRADFGDTIVVGPGKYGPFEVDRPLKIEGIGLPTIVAAVQRPGITISSDDVVISGFMIKGVAEDSNSKFDYYLKHPEMAALRLDLPNAGILMRGDRVVVQDTNFSGAEVGILVDGSANSSLMNLTYDRCGRGAEIRNGRGGWIERCRSWGCRKAGLYIERSSGMTVANNSIADTVNEGIFLKETVGSIVTNNSLSGNKEGIFLWNSSLISISGNRVNQSYYAILISESNNNTILDNLVEDNRRSEIIPGFGVGISLQANSSFNIAVRNIARKSFNGFEITKGCHSNIFCCNNATDNTHGIRTDKSYNNLIWCNNFIRNTISVYDNSSHNIWNTTAGNYYSDYSGADEDGDGIGDLPYSMPKGVSKSVDARPLIKPCSTILPDIGQLYAELAEYATYIPEDDPESESYQPYRRLGGAIIIESRRPTSSPKWPESKPLL